MRFLSILATKSSAAILRRLGRGGSMPGQIGLKLDPQILKKLKIHAPVILVTGTNGKTSTANMITSMFEAAGYHVISNRKGDNLREGIVTTLLTHTDMSGKVNADAIVLEVDELNIKHILPNLPVSTLVVNNFFRDQLDRAREMEQLIDSIENVLPGYRQTLVLNGNDPNVVRLYLKAPKAHIVYFGLAKNKYSVEKTNEASEGKFCPRCGHRLVYSYYQYSHIGSFCCPECHFRTPILNVELKNIDLKDHTFTLHGEKFKDPYDGMYSMYNCAAVLAVADLYNIDTRHVKEVFANAPQPKGRNEKFSLDGRNVILNLVKNPTGANEVMKVIEEDRNKKTIVIVLNDNDQDGTDVSWIYDTHFEKLMNEATTRIITTGKRGFDMALRLYYGGYKGILEQKDTIEEAFNEAVRDKDDIYVIATYTALLPARSVIEKQVKNYG
ncbi:Mur ligase family protein [uncultured Dubosiella sp.]|uniref:Mur ligase family protein n=1 Tax=uncultured Dubosiella sp. TaxID=1937011 RepID=UPI00273229DE|nr:Mur ligase family protein [uncultured Dubosiella sp.]